MNYKEEIYIMMEINYLKANNRNLDGDNDDLFPLNWYLISDYQKKAEILLEAINNNEKIVDTQKYREMKYDVL